MKPQKLTRAIHALTKVEQRRFSQFLHSPYFNQRQDIIRLYDGLLEMKDPDQITELYAKIFPESAFSPSTFRLLMSYLQKSMDQFLAVEHWKNTPAAVEIDLVRAYRTKALDRHFHDALQAAKLALERQPLRNSEYYVGSGALLWEEARFNSLSLPEDEQYLIGLSGNADLVWLTQKLRYLCLHTGYRTRFNSARSLSLRQEIEGILESNHFLDNMAISTWYYCLKMLESPDAAEYFSRFKQGVITHSLLFHHDELHDLHLFAINYCIKRVNEGNTAFFHDIMDFYKDGLIKGHLLDNGVLSHFTYHNIVAAGLKTHEYEWVEGFIPGYRNALERRYRDSAYSFNLARLKFARKSYNEALELLQHSNYHEPLLNMAAKTIAIKIYYALAEYEVLEAHIEAFIKYIRRKPGLGYHRNNYLLLARLVQKLIHLNWNDKTEVQTLRQKIVDEPVLTEREWLLEQF